MSETKPTSADTVSRGAVIAMVSIVFVLACVALFSNWQRTHRDRFEKTTVTPLAATPYPSPTISSAP
ncbi:MAG: hypothetical protein M3R59_06855 [Verrucomicrobiota bacterium]|nr:hypothetical protein [Verrucomicrobiota bacterium]